MTARVVSKLKFAHVMLGLRSLVLIAGAGFIAANARGYFIHRWGLSVPLTIYGPGAFAFVWIVVWLSTRKLIGELKVDAPSWKSSIMTSELKYNEYDRETVYKYPAHLGYLLTTLGVFLVVLPYLSAGPDSSVALVTLVVCLIVGCIVFLIAFYIFIYSVTITGDKIIIKGFITLQSDIEDIANIHIETTKNGPQAVITFNNGKIIRVGRMVKDFVGLVERLTAITSETYDQKKRNK